MSQPCVPVRRVGGGHRPFHLGSLDYLFYYAYPGRRVTCPVAERIIIILIHSNIQHPIMSSGGVGATPPRGVTRTCSDSCCTPNAKRRRYLYPESARKGQRVRITAATWATIISAMVTLAATHPERLPAGALKTDGSFKDNVSIIDAFVSEYQHNKSIADEVRRSDTGLDGKLEKALHERDASRLEAKQLKRKIGQLPLRRVVHARCVCWLLWPRPSRHRGRPAMAGRFGSPGSKETIRVRPTPPSAL